MKVSGCRRPEAETGGFTLLELVLAMGLLALLVGMVFSTATTNVNLANAIVERKNEESTQNAFLELMNKRFGSLPGNTRMKLEFEERGGRYLYDLTLQNVPLSFTWGGTEQVAKAVRLSTVEQRDGYLNVVLRYYEEELLQDSDNAEERTDLEPFAEVTLLRGVRMFEWMVLDGRSSEWLETWDLNGRLPLQLELIMAFGQDGPPIRQVFWIVPKLDPEVLMRQMMQSGGGGGGGGGGGDDR